MDEPNNAQQTDQTGDAQAQAQEPGGTPNDAGQAEGQPSQAPQTGEGQGGEPKAPSFGSLLDSGDDGEEGGQKGAPSNGDQEDGAPESYEPFSVDGQTIEVENAQEFVDMAKELGLSQEKAQKVMDAMVPAARNYLMKDLSAKARVWEEETRKDPEIGGANFEANQGIAMAAYKQFATPALRTILTGSGLGNHPEVVRLFYRIGKSMQQDKGVAGDGTTPAQPRRLYPKSNMVIG